MNPAVILMDMQEYFLKGRSEEHKNSLIQSQLEVITYCAETDAPLIVIEYNLDSPEIKGCLLETVPCLSERVCSVPRNKKVIKNTDNALLSSRPNLRRLLRSFEADYLVLMGINASACCKSTALTCLDRGYKIRTSADLISDDISYDLMSKRNPPDDSIRIYNDGLEFYRKKCNFFNTHKDLIAHLEEKR